MTNVNATPSLCSAAGAVASGTGIALASEGGAPEWVQLLPAGPELTGRDGRHWQLPDPQTVIAAFNAFGRSIALDWEHSQDRRAVNGEEAPASGWIEAMEVRDGQVWGRVAWTPKGRRAVTAREYRFLSPAFTHTASGEVVAIVGGGLVNRPNFNMASLASQDVKMEKLLLALGLLATASEGDALAAIAGLKTKSLAGEMPSMTLYVPRADLDAALARETALKTQIASTATAARETEIAAAVDAALAAGKIAPSSREFYTANCRAEGGLERFAAFVAQSASLFTPVVDAKKAPGADATALASEEETVRKQLGISPEDFRAAKLSRAA